MSDMTVSDARARLADVVDTPRVDHTLAAPDMGRDSAGGAGSALEALPRRGEPLISWAIGGDSDD